MDQENNLSHVLLVNALKSSLPENAKSFERENWVTLLNQWKLQVRQSNSPVFSFLKGYVAFNYLAPVKSDSRYN